MGGLTVTKSEHPTCWRLTQSGEDPLSMEEVVVRLQGIICDENLPPVTFMPR